MRGARITRAEEKVSGYSAARTPASLLPQNLSQFSVGYVNLGLGCCYSERVPEARTLDLRLLRLAAGCTFLNC